MKLAQYKTTSIIKVLAFCIVHLETNFLQFKFCQAAPCSALKMSKGHFWSVPLGWLVADHWNGSLESLGADIN